MADTEQHRATLQELNGNYIRSVDEADIAWFDANLAADFFNTNPDGTFIDRKAFLGNYSPLCGSVTQACRIERGAAG